MGSCGSTIRSEATHESDVDLLIEINNPQLTLFQLIELRDYLSDLLRISVGVVHPAVRP